MTFEISDIVDVNSQVFSGAVARRDFGRGLFFTTDGTLAAAGTGKVREFANMTEVEAVFQAGSEPHKAATTWFSQDPFPKSLFVARWSNTDVNTTITGGTPQSAADIDDVSAGSFVIGGESVTGIDLSAQNTYEKIAATIQTELQELFSGGPTDDRFEGALCSFANGRFTIALPSRADIGGALVNAASGTNLAPLLGLDAASGAVYKEGANLETVSEALAAVEQINNAWYWLIVDNGIVDTDDMKSVAAWAATRRVQLFGEVQDEAAQTPNEATTIAAEISALRYGRTSLIYSEHEDYLAASAAARFSSVRFEQPNSLITLKFKQAPGITPSNISRDGRVELDRKRINYYAEYGSDAIIAEGVTLDPKLYIDVRYWLDWLVNAVEVDVWNLFRTLPRVPQTAAGVAALRNTIEIPMEEGVLNGGIAPGVVSPAMRHDIITSTGALDFDGTLTKGYLVWIGSLADQSQTDREARKAPPTKVWMKGSGAFHFADISLIFEN